MTRGLLAIRRAEAKAWASLERLAIENGDE
jgi:hypothetical protein